MMNMTVFTTREELSQLTGLDRNALWDAGFNLDDWDIGFCCDEKFHTGREPEEEEIEIQDSRTSGWGWGFQKHEDEEYKEDEEEGVCVDYESPYSWLMSAMCNYCVGPSYTFYGGKHYYLVHHA